ncbi:MAG: hypothetical protein R3F34_13625 [Planctomycetota bacterium]
MHLVIVLDAFAYGVHRVVESPGIAAFAALPPLLLLATVAVERVRRSGAKVGAEPRRLAVRGVAWGLAVMLVARLAFFTWWQASNLEYAVGHHVPLLALGATVFTTRSVPVLLFVAAIELGVNATQLVLPFRTDAAHEDAELLLAEAGDDGAVIALDPMSLLALRRAANGGASIVDGAPPLSDDDVRSIADDVRRRVGSGARVVGVNDVAVAMRLGLPGVVPDPGLAAALVAIVAFRRVDTGGALAGYLLAKD